MKPTRVIFGTFFVMLVVQTYNTVDSQHKLPAPRKFVAIGAVWGVLFLLADVGFGKVASRLSALVLLTGLVIGPFGSLLIKFFNLISTNFAIPPEDDTAPGGVPGAPGITPTRPRGRIA